MTPSSYSIHITESKSDLETLHKIKGEYKQTKSESTFSSHEIAGSWYNEVDLLPSFPMHPINDLGEKHRYMGQKSKGLELGHQQLPVLN